MGIWICSVDFDNSKVYGDTTILDGLVNILKCRKSFNAKEDSPYTNVKDIDPKNIQPYQTHVEDFEVQGVFL